MGRDASPAIAVMRSAVWPTFCFLLACVLIPFLAPILLMLRAYRNWLMNRLRHRSSHVEVMSLMDALWYQTTSRNPGLINGLFWFKGTPSNKKWRNIVNERMVSARDLNGQLRYPKLTMMPMCVWHRYVWVDCEDFDLNKTCHKYEGEMPKNNQELEVIIGKLCSSGIPHTEPQWEFILIPFTYNGEPEYVCMVRMHHAIGDGVSIVRMLINNFSDQSKKQVSAPKEKVAKEKFATKRNIMIALKAVLTAPMNACDRIFTLYQKNALHGPKLSGHQLATWSRTIDLDFIKKLKDAAGCTVNDILMASLALTFKAYFKQNCSATPEGIRCSIPVDVRRPDPNDTTLDNMFSLVFLQLPLGEAGARETTVEVKRRMDAIKNSAEPLLNFLSIKFLLSRLPSYLGSLAIDLMCDQSTVVVSNVPGPKDPLIMNDDEVQKAIFWPPNRSDVGMSVSLLSYNNSVTLGFIVDKMIMSNPQRLVDMFYESLSTMAKDLGVPETINMHNVDSSDC